jgi:hypothetical protein
VVRSCIRVVSVGIMTALNGVLILDQLVIDGYFLSFLGSSLFHITTICIKDLKISAIRL